MELKEIKCPKCKHFWGTKSKLKLVTCPSCQLKVKNKIQEIKERYIKNLKGGRNG